MRTLTILAVGVVIGLLIAPDSGVNTRKDLSKFLDAIKGRHPNANDNVTSDDVINS
jgi:gas vesicle protein